MFSNYGLSIHRKTRNPDCNYPPRFQTPDAMFDKNNHTERPAVSCLDFNSRPPFTYTFFEFSDTSLFKPIIPDIDNIEYPRAASWSSCTVDEILKDPIGMFHMTQCI